MSAFKSINEGLKKVYEAQSAQANSITFVGPFHDEAFLQAIESIEGNAEYSDPAPVTRNEENDTITLMFDPAYPYEAVELVAFYGDLLSNEDDWFLEEYDELIQKALDGGLDNY